MDLAKLITDFVFTTIIGHESGSHKLYSKDNTDLLILKQDEIMMVFANITMHYLNSAYTSLILKNDDYIIQKFSAMKKINNHSEICLLNIIFSFILSTHVSIDRKKLDVTSYNAYMASIQDQLEGLYDGVLNKISQSISHTCTGIDISTCDPNEKLFYTMDEKGNRL